MPDWILSALEVNGSTAGAPSCGMSTLSQAESSIPGFPLALPSQLPASTIANDPHSSGALVSGRDVVAVNDPRHAATRRHQTGSVSPFRGPSREPHIQMPTNRRRVTKPRCLLPRERRLFGGTQIQNPRERWLPRRTYGRPEEPALPAITSFPASQTTLDQESLADAQVPMEVALFLFEIYLERHYQAHLLFRKDGLIEGYKIGNSCRYVILATFAFASLFLHSVPGGIFQGEVGITQVSLADWQVIGQRWAEEASQQALMRADEPCLELVQACQVLALFCLENSRFYIDCWASIEGRRLPADDDDITKGPPYYLDKSGTLMSTGESAELSFNSALIMVQGLWSIYELCLVYLYSSVVPALSCRTETRRFSQPMLQQAAEQAYEHCLRITSMAEQYLSSRASASKLWPIAGYSAYVCAAVQLRRCLAIGSLDQAWYERNKANLQLTGELGRYWMTLQPLVTDKPAELSTHVRIYAASNDDVPGSGVQEGQSTADGVMETPPVSDAQNASVPSSEFVGPSISTTTHQPPTSSNVVLKEDSVDRMPTGSSWELRVEPIWWNQGPEMLGDIFGNNLFLPDSVGYSMDMC
ncbi:hypothetical protein IWW34DRAFT_855699 [Fusarium oxysporum f. sp. albedinis]|nr:hypothetical protein IWW34DRAFT_855699 [Fusarium oxysporum f. sp. albedinis]